MVVMYCSIGGGKTCTECGSEQTSMRHWGHSHGVHEGGGVVGESSNEQWHGRGGHHGEMTRERRPGCTKPMFASSGDGGIQFVEQRQHGVRSGSVLTEQRATRWTNTLK